MHDVIGFRRYPERTTNKEPTQSCRFNAIHYPKLFLHHNRNRARLPLSLTMSDAVKFGMYKEEFTYFDRRTRKLRILTIPMVNSHQALQVTIYIITV